MSFKLISHVNGDNDLIEAWLKYYLQLGVERFHLVVHGSPEENSRLLAIKDSYPITIEDTYGGSFHIDEKKGRLDAVLARHTGQWVLLVDSDEFVEFPYRDIPETVRHLECARANLLAAPMVQRLTADGSLETPPVIDDPFQFFPFCSVDLYRRMGVKGDIFKFPLFFCADGTRLSEGGNHHPALGQPPRGSKALAVTHHFKFRRTVSRRLESRINSAHPWRHESAQFREYLAEHSNRLPLESAFVYSRDELFRRELLRKLPALTKTQGAGERPRSSAGASGNRDGVKQLPVEASLKVPAGQQLVFVLPQSREFGGLEKHLLDFLCRLQQPAKPPIILCFGQDIISGHMDNDERNRVIVRCAQEPKTLGEWIVLIRSAEPDVLVFAYSWLKAFSWKAPVAAFLAGVRKRFSIQHLIPPPAPASVEGRSPGAVLRRLFGRRARYFMSARLSGYAVNKTICVSKAVRETLTAVYGFPPKKTLTVSNGVSTSAFTPSKENGAALRAKLGISQEQFLLVCAARLAKDKGIDLLLHAVSRVVRQGVPCKCIILGEGLLRQSLEQELNALGLWNHVYFEGFQKDVRPYLQAGSAFILLSYLEGLPLSVLEAMACGLPCIVTDVGGSAEVVRNRINGLVIAPGSLEGAEDAILYLSTHPAERAAMAKNARETVCQEFNIERSMHELARVILN